MSNTFGTDILIQAEDPMKAASFYVQELGFEITDKNPGIIGLQGKNVNLFIEPGPALGPVLEVTVKNVEKAKENLTKKGLRNNKGRTCVSAMLRQRSERPDLQSDGMTRS